MRQIYLFFIFIFIFCACQSTGEDASGDPTLRIATFNIEDVRTDDLQRADHPRLQKIAQIIAQIRPDILLINEIAYDMPGVPGYESPAGQNGQRFADILKTAAAANGWDLPDYIAFSAPSNTGIASGFDLDRNGTVVTDFPAPPPAGEDGAPARQTAEGRAYGGDCWGFGTFPGQYAMALLVRSDLKVKVAEARTFQKLAWASMPANRMPVVPGSDARWYAGPAGEQFRLSSKSHWDVPIELPGGTVLHVLCSHPTPPAFDGEEGRNKRRNHDEIRFWADYLDNADYISDDRGVRGGLRQPASFVIMGDQNADPEKGASLDDPIGTFLLSHPLVNGEVVPLADPDAPGVADLPREKTARWGLRVDYVLPSVNLAVTGSGIYRYPPEWAVSDHFPVWVDIKVSD